MAADLQGMQGLMHHARSAAAQLALRVRNGEIAVNPARTKQAKGGLACEYCRAAAICGRDPSLPTTQERDYSAEDRDALWAAMLGEKENQAVEDIWAPRGAK